jgi:hypothetical protein
MNQEIALLAKAAAVQDSVRKAVLAREWTDFDWKMAEISQIGGEFSLLEEERAGLFSALAPRAGGESLSGEKTESPPFYELACGLPQVQRRELSLLYRTLKMETLKMRVFNESFLGYLLESKTMAAAYLEAVFPARGGKLYTRKGSQVKGDLKSMVLNRHI